MNRPSAWWWFAVVALIALVVLVVRCIAWDLATGRLAP